MSKLQTFALGGLVFYALLKLLQLADWWRGA